MQEHLEELDACYDDLVKAIGRFQKANDNWNGENRQGEQLIEDRGMEVYLVCDDMIKLLRKIQESK